MFITKAAIKELIKTSNNYILEAEIKYLENKVNKLNSELSEAQKTHIDSIRSIKKALVDTNIVKIRNTTVYSIVEGFENIKPDYNQISNDTAINLAVNVIMQQRIGDCK